MSIVLCFLTIMLAVMLVCFFSIERRLRDVQRGIDAVVRKLE